MKLSIIIIFLFFLSFGVKLSAQEISQQDKQEIISYLDSSDVFGAINTIIEYKITEAGQKVEQVFWNNNFTSFDRLRLLDILLMSNSSLTESYALAYLDTLNNITPNPSYEKAMTAGILLKVGNISKVQLIFDYIDKDSSSITLSTINLLPYIINNAPEFEQRAKEVLINIVHNSDWDLERRSSLRKLYQIYGNEMKPLLIKVFEQDDSPTNKAIVLDTLVTNFKSEEIHNLLKERIVQDTSYYVRYHIAEKLLNSFGTPSDYEFINNYSKSEPNAEVKDFLRLDMIGYHPPKPDSNVSVNALLNDLIALTDSVQSYSWLGDLNFINQLKNNLQSAKTKLSSSDSLGAAKDVKAFQDSVDNVYKDSLNTNPQFVTLEGWKFLYWNAQYILDRLPKIPQTNTADLIVKLINSSGNLLTGGELKYYEGSWKDAVSYGNGLFGVNTDKAKVSLRMIYEYGNQTIQNVTVGNDTAVFQTVNTSVQLKNSLGSLIDTGEVKYYAGAWRDFGTTSNGIATKELLPKNYSFRMIHGFISNDKQQDIGTNNTVTFSTVLCTVKVNDNQNQPIDGASVQYYSSAPGAIGWKNIGTTVNGEVTKQMLPKNLTFRANYNGSHKDKAQDITNNNLVEIILP